ncbi:LptF/LptG family permease [bacterium]|nr:LptF/LptG family permease [bacterium]
MNFLLELYKKIYAWIDSKITVLDRYILKQVIEVFILGIIIFTAIIFASDAFITLIKQISLYGIPFHVALMMIMLNIPAVIVMTIPMGSLFATVMTLNKLCLSSEITVMRACSIGLNRIAKPIFIFATIMALLSFTINETIVPAMNKQSKILAMWALGQKNIPNGKQNFSFKELKDGNILKKLFFIQKCEDNELHNIVVLDLSNKNTIQIIQAENGATSTDGWVFNNGAVYTIENNQKVLNTTWFENSIVDFGLDLKEEMSSDDVTQYNIIALYKNIKRNKPIEQEIMTKMKIHFFDKFALPITTIVFVLIGVPLAITPPRVRYNRGFLFSILIIFLYYLIRALSMSFGETNAINPYLAAWAPNLIIATIGGYLYYKKVFTIQ